MKARPPQSARRRLWGRLAGSVFVDVFIIIFAVYQSRSLHGCILGILQLICIAEIVKEAVCEI